MLGSIISHVFPWNLTDKLICDIRHSNTKDSLQSKYKPQISFSQIRIISCITKTDINYKSVFPIFSQFRIMSRNLLIRSTTLSDVARANSFRVTFSCFDCMESTTSLARTSEKELDRYGRGCVTSATRIRPFLMRFSHTL